MCIAVFIPYSISHMVGIDVASRKAEVEKLEKGVNLLVASPGRLLDHLQGTKACCFFTGKFVLINVAFRDSCTEI